MINIPNENKRWNQNNKSDLFGNIAVTKNITFDKAGYLQLSASSRALMNEIVDTDFGLAMGIIPNEDYGYFIATSDQCFEMSTEPLSARPTQIATSGVPSGDIQSDVAYFEGLMVVSQDTDVDYYDTSANTWTDTNISLTLNGQHPLAYMPSLSALAVANVNTIKLYAKPITATPTLITTLTISSDLEITGIKYFNQNLYIATQNVVGGDAYMYVWNGLGTSAQQAYKIDSMIIYNIEVHENTIVVTAGDGGLYQFTGSGFSLLDALPMYYTNQTMGDNGNIDIFQSTLKSTGGILYWIVSNDNNEDNRLTNQPDGIWCFDKDVGLYHRYSLSNALVQIESIASGSVNTTTDQITTTNNYVTGTEVVFFVGSTLAPLIDANKYFVINVDSTHIKLATTLANALAGTAIDLTSVGGTITLIFFPNVDFGQFTNERTSNITPIFKITPNKILGTDLIWAGEITRRDATTAYDTLGVISEGVESRGYFITPKIFSQDLTDKFNLISLKFAPFISDLDKIVIKYRTEDDRLDYIKLDDWDITWTSTTTFTSTETGWATAVAGNEIEVLSGAGGGLLAHISTITENAGTYTITIDETFANYVSGDVARAIFRNWTKFTTIISTNTNGYFAETLGAEGKFLQLKIELRGVNVIIEDLKVDNKYHLPAIR